jgi:tripartite-type tricarboxylate transporter receptor subunit TctC
LRLAAQAYGPASIAYSLPPGLPKDRVQTLQTAFMATMRDAEFLAEANKSKLVVSPLDGPTIEQTVAEPYRAESKLLERFREIIEVSQPER